MDGGSDEAGATILGTVISHPITGVSMIALISASAIALYSVKSDISRVNDQIIQDRQVAQELRTRVDRVEEKTTEKLDRMQNDLGEVKTSVRGLDVGIQGLNRNVEALIRQNTPAPPR